MIEEIGFYLDKNNEVWELVNFPEHALADGIMVIMKRISDKHTDVFYKTGDNIDPTKPLITTHLTREDYPEYFL